MTFINNNRAATSLTFSLAAFKARDGGGGGVVVAAGPDGAGGVVDGLIS